MTTPRNDAVADAVAELVQLTELLMNAYCGAATSVEEVEAAWVRYDELKAFVLAHAPHAEGVGE